MAPHLIVAQPHHRIAQYFDPKKERITPLAIKPQHITTSQCENELVNYKIPKQYCQYFCSFQNIVVEDPQVIYEDNHLLVLHKPTGWLVQGDKTGDQTLTDWGRAYIKERYQKPGAVFLHPTHRLDRPVSGITVFARTSKALERINKLFREDQVTKTYLAVVQNHPQQPEGTLTHWLYKDTQKNLVKAYAKPGGNTKKAELAYRLLAQDRGLSLLKVMPKTGRSHQIRVQLAAMKTSIKGDLKYGFPHPNSDKSIHLHAFQLSFVHPVKKEEVTFNCAPKWEEFKHQIDELDRQTSK